MNAMWQKAQPKRKKAYRLGTR